MTYCKTQKDPRNSDPARYVMSAFKTLFLNYLHILPKQSKITSYKGIFFFICNKLILTEGIHIIKFFKKKETSLYKRYIS